MMPSDVALDPQLLSRASEPPAGDDWLHEIKYDGYRLLASLERGRVRLVSRSGADWTGRLPLIAKAVAVLGTQSAILDGELVFLTSEGFPDFERLRAATQSSDQASLYYQAFDLLAMNGRDLTVRPLIDRKDCLGALVPQGASHSRLRYVAHTQGNGAEFFRAVDQLGLEGVVSKRAMSLYRAGVRSTDWVKVKCFRTHHFTVVGFTTEEGSAGKVLLSSLALAGVDDECRLTYAGRVEYGVPRRDDSLLKALQSLSEPRTTIAGASQHSSIRWVEPRLAAEVRCLLWQPGRHIRHATLRGVSVADQC